MLSSASMQLKSCFAARTALRTSVMTLLQVQRHALAQSFTVQFGSTVRRTISTESFTRGLLSSYRNTSLFNSRARSLDAGFSSRSVSLPLSGISTGSCHIRSDFPRHLSTGRSEDVSLKPVKAEEIDKDSQEKEEVSGDVLPTGTREWPGIGSGEEGPLDVDREMLRYNYEEFESGPVEEVVEVKRTHPISLERGVSGVFDVAELVAVLREENARDICAIRVPRELRYVDYIVIGTGKSTRHLNAMAAYIRWAYKQKRGPFDPESVKIEGELSKDWFALDLGNIAVHLFLRETRRVYDLEQLWTVGPEFDDKTRSLAEDSAGSVFSLDGFSFDAELEKFRKLRGEELTQNQEGSR